MRNIVAAILFFMCTLLFAGGTESKDNLASTSGIPSGYYDGTENLTGQSLKNKLHKIIRGHTRRGYSQAREDLKVTDEDPNNSSNVILLYKGISSPKSNFGGGANNWNREHVWPKSHGFPSSGDTAYSDIHHLRPTDASVNSDRGNKDFDNGGTQNPEATGCYSDGDSWEPRDAVKGDCARMVFYMSTRYESNRLDLEIVDFSGTSGAKLGVLSTLLEWHANDPVDTFETHRNNKIYNLQGNRNPFVDHPEFVTKIWADTGTTPPPPPPSSDSTFYISEVSDGSFTAVEFLEIYNNSADTVVLTGAKLVRLEASGNFNGYVFDFGSDGSGDVKVMPYNLLIVARGATKSEFEGAWGPIPAGVGFNQGSSDLYFGSGTARRWALTVGGTANTFDGKMIDDTEAGVAGSGNRSFQNSIGSWITENSIANSTPGFLDDDQVLPVELTSFSVQGFDNYAILNWQTATEQNNLGFDVLRSTEQNDEWLKIGFIEGQGTSNNLNYYSFIDENVALSGKYLYKLKQIDFDGSSSFSKTLAFEVEAPEKTTLFQNSPNPFNPSTNIEFEISSPQRVVLEVYDIKGEKIVSLVNKNLQAGLHKYSFDGSSLASGVYFYRLITDKIQIKKMNLIK